MNPQALAPQKCVLRTSFPLRFTSVAGGPPILSERQSSLCKHKRLVFLTVHALLLTRKKVPCNEFHHCKGRVIFTLAVPPRLLLPTYRIGKSHFIWMITVSFPCCSSQPLRGGLQTSPTKKLTPMLLSLKIFYALLFSSTHL